MDHDTRQRMYELAEGGDAKPGAVSHRADGDYVKQSDGTWKKKTDKGTYTIKRDFKDKDDDSSHSVWHEKPTGGHRHIGFFKGAKAAKDAADQHAAGTLPREKMTPR